VLLSQFLSYQISQGFADQFAPIDLFPMTYPENKDPQRPVINIVDCAVFTHAKAKSIFLAF